MSDFDDNSDVSDQTPVTYINDNLPYISEIEKNELFVIVLCPSTTVDIGDLMKGTYYNVTIYANNSVGRSPVSNDLTARIDID